MSNAFDYRGQLLNAVQAFLEENPGSEDRGRQIVHACPATTPFTLDFITWGSIISLLTDLLFFRDAEFLRDLQRFLAGDSWELRRGMITYDFLPFMDEHERACYEILQRLVALVEGFPEALAAPDVDEYVQRGGQLQDQARATLAALPRIEYRGDETVYHLVLRETGSILVNINLEFARQHEQLVFPGGAIFAARYRMELPDGSGAVAWVKRALAALARQDALWLTWQIHAGGLFFSLL
ncbi:MAG TPA: hypothetical protein VGP82_03175 [Ktedonobacterales bacterium]|nr:hypothetical protein [Ktedonobacterales bacterium]